MHNCQNFLTYDASRSEVVCTRCGVVIEDEELRAQFYTELMDMTEFPDSAKKLTAEDHNAGCGLLESITPQTDYVSKHSPGVAFALNNTRSRDAQGKRIKRQLVDPYNVGNVVGKAMVMREDRLTGESQLRFSMYEKPYLSLLRERANIELTRYNLSTTDKSIVAVFLKQICSRLAFGEMQDYCWMAAALNSGLLKPKDAAELEKQMYDVIGQLRSKLLSRCDPKIMKAMKEQEQAKMQPEGIEAK